MEVCYTDTYENFNINNGEDYKGEFFNNNDDDEEELKFFEFGAHFPYELLCKKLEELVKSNHNQENDKKNAKILNVNTQKSRNINNNHNNNTTNLHHPGKASKVNGKYINSILSVGIKNNTNSNNIVKNKKNNKSSLAIPSFTFIDKKNNCENGQKKVNFKNLLYNHNHIPIRTGESKDNASTKVSSYLKPQTKQHLSCSYQNLKKAISPHISKNVYGITSIKYQKIQTNNAKPKNAHLINVNNQSNIKQNSNCNNIKSRNTNKNSTLIPNNLNLNNKNETRTFHKSETENSNKENTIKEKGIIRQKPHSVEKPSKSRVFKNSISSSDNHKANGMSNVSLTSFKNTNHTLTSIMSKEDKNSIIKSASKSKYLKKTITSSSPPSHNSNSKLPSRNYRNASVIKNAIIRSINNKTQNSCLKYHHSKNIILSNTINQTISSLISHCKSGKKIEHNSKTKNGLK